MTGKPMWLNILQDTTDPEGVAGKIKGLQSLGESHGTTRVNILKDSKSSDTQRGKTTEGDRVRQRLKEIWKKQQADRKAARKTAQYLRRDKARERLCEKIKRQWLSRRGGPEEDEKNERWRTYRERYKKKNKIVNKKSGAPRIYPSLYHRILANTMHIPWSGCWIYLGTLTKNSYGYGIISVDDGRRKSKRSLHVHRIMYMYANNKDLDGSVHLRHTCHIPACWNPDHLREGTPKENVGDAIKRGTHVGFSKINEEKKNKLQKRTEINQYLVKRIVDKGY